MKNILLAITTTLLVSCSSSKSNQPDVVDNPDELNKLSAPVAIAVELRVPIELLAIAILISRIRLGGDITKHTHYHGSDEKEKP